MNQRPTEFPISPRALMELQLSDWQFQADQQKEETPPAEVAFVKRQISRLRIELAIDSPMSDTHVRSKTHGDEPAFVVPGEFDGLSKREYMATQFLAGMVAAKGPYYNANEVAGFAVEHADALINALNK
ncbi:hypothetical protein [Spirosoma aerophilum]